MSINRKTRKSIVLLLFLALAFVLYEWLDDGSRAVETTDPSSLNSRSVQHEEKVPSVQRSAPHVMPNRVPKSISSAKGLLTYRDARGVVGASIKVRPGGSASPEPVVCQTDSRGNYNFPFELTGSSRALSVEISLPCRVRPIVREVLVSGGGGSFNLPQIEIEDQIDAWVSLELQAGLDDVLEAAGVRSISVILADQAKSDGPRLHVLHRLERELSSARGRELVSIPYVERLLVVAAIHSNKAGLMAEFATGVLRQTITLDRSSVPNIKIGIDTSGLIVGRVVSRNGRPVVGADIDLRPAGQPRGGKRVTTSNTGGFCVAVAAGKKFDLRAKFYSLTRGATVQVSSGDLGLRIELDMSKAVRAKIRTSKGFLSTFFLQHLSYLFNDQGPPTFPTYENDEIFLPFGRLEKGDKWYLSWMSNGKPTEVLVEIPKTVVGGKEPLIITAPPPQIMGTLQVTLSKEADEGIGLWLRQAEPERSKLSWPLDLVSFSRGRKSWLVRGIHPGRYSATFKNVSGGILKQEDVLLHAGSQRISFP